MHKIYILSKYEMTSNYLKALTFAVDLTLYCVEETMWMLLCSECVREREDAVSLNVCEREDAESMKRWWNYNELHTMFTRRGNGVSIGRRADGSGCYGVNELWWKLNVYAMGSRGFGWVIRSPWTFSLLPHCTENLMAPRLLHKGMPNTGYMRLEENDFCNKLPLGCWFWLGFAFTKFVGVWL